MSKITQKKNGAKKEPRQKTQIDFTELNKLIEQDDEKYKEKKLLKDKESGIFKISGIFKNRTNKIAPVNESFIEEKKTTTRKNLKPIVLSLNGIKKLEQLKQEEEEEKKAKEIKQMKENKTFQIKCIINSLDRYFYKRIELRVKRNNELMELMKKMNNQLKLNSEMIESYKKTHETIFEMTLGDFIKANFLNGDFLKSNKKNLDQSVRILLRIHEVRNQIEIYKQEISEIVKNNSQEVSSLLDFKLKDLNEYNDNC
jgi:hypothetical protein